MRIVLAHSRLNTYGGGERATLELLRRLGARHEVTLWAGGYAPERTFPEFRDYPLRRMTTLGWLAATPDADAVVAHTFGANLLALRHPSTICYLHTLRSPYARGGGRPDLALRRALERRALRRAAHVATNSAYSADRAAALYGIRPQVVPLGADEALLGLAPRLGIYALYVGRLAPEKGLDRLLAWSRDVPVPLVLVGDGDAAYVAHLKGLAGPQVRFAGPLTGAALVDAYENARYFVFVPHREEFGLAALDALAAAKPVIAAAEGGPLEYIRDGTNGLLIHDAAEFAEASRRLLADDTLCQRLGAQAREDTHRYSWDAYAHAIEALCQQRAGIR